MEQGVHLSWQQGHQPMLPNQDTIKRAQLSRQAQHPPWPSCNATHTPSGTIGAPQTGTVGPGAQPVFYSYPPTAMATGGSADHTREQHNLPKPIPSQPVGSYSTLASAMIMQTPSMHRPHSKANGTNEPHSTVATSSWAKERAAQIPHEKERTDDQEQRAQHAQKEQRENQQQAQQGVQLNNEQQLRQQAHQQQHFYHHQQSQLQQLEQARLYMRSQSSQPAQPPPQQQSAHNAQNHHSQDCPKQSPQQQQHALQQEQLNHFQQQLLQLLLLQQDQLRRQRQPAPQPCYTQNPFPTLPQNRRKEKISEITSPQPSSSTPANQTPAQHSASNAHDSTPLSLSKIEERCKLDSAFLNRCVAKFSSHPRYVPRIVAACEDKQTQFRKERSKRDKPYTESQSINTMAGLRLDNSFDVEKALGDFASATGRLSGGMVSTDSLDREASLLSRAFVQTIETVKMHDGILKTMREENPSSFAKQDSAQRTNETGFVVIVHELQDKVNSQHQLLQSLLERITHLEKKDLICSRCASTEKNVPPDTQQTQDDQSEVSSNQTATGETFASSDRTTKVNKMESRDAACQHEEEGASTANATVGSERKADKEVQAGISSPQPQHRKAAGESTTGEGKTGIEGAIEIQDEVPLIADEKEQPVVGESDIPILSNEQRHADGESEMRIVIDNEQSIADEGSDMSIVHSERQSLDDGSEKSSPGRSVDERSGKDADGRISYADYVSHLKQRVDQQLSKSKAGSQEAREVSKVIRLGTPPLAQLRSPMPSPPCIKVDRRQEITDKSGIIDLVDSSDESSTSGDSDHEGRLPVTRRITRPDEDDDNLSEDDKAGLSVNLAQRESLKLRKRGTTSSPGSDEKEPKRSKQKTHG